MKRMRKTVGEDFLLGVHLVLVATRQDAKAVDLQVGALHAILGKARSHRTRINGLANRLKFAFPRFQILNDEINAYMLRLFLGTEDRKLDWREVLTVSYLPSEAEICASLGLAKES